MQELAAVFIGGGIGSLIRYAISLLWQHFSLHPNFQSTTMPWHTLAINVIGSLAIGCIYQYSERWGISAETRLFLATGVCGGFTTFSTFSYEGITLLREGYYSTFILYVLLSITLGMAAAVLPYAICSRSI